MDKLAVSQKDIAKAAGVSTATVSRALCNHPAIPEETRGRIAAAAEKLGYKKNPLVSMLNAQLRSSRHTSIKSTLAYVTTLTHPRLSDISPTYHQFYVGAKERALELGYGLDLLWRKEPGMSSARFTKILRSRGIKGLILAPRPNPLGHISLDWNLFSVATIGHDLPAPRVSFAAAWHYAIIDKALRILKKYGYRRVGFAISSHSDGYANHAFSSRYSFYSHTLPARSRIPFLQDPLGTEPLNQKSVIAWYERYKPDVILCQGPLVGDWLTKAGIRIPQEVALADLCLPDDSGMTAGIFEMPKVIGATAVELVVEQLHHNITGVPENRKAVLFDGKWVDGKTVVNKSKSKEAAVSKQSG